MVRRPPSAVHLFMSTPVAAVSSAPTFGGLTGYKRPVLGKPTQVPSNLPAFRGKQFTPGSNSLKAPPIQASKNRQDRGTNVTIPYARTCPIDHSCDLGRIAAGDVVFTSRYQVDVTHIGHRKERVVGIDFLNKALGNDDSIKGRYANINPNWVVGKTVLLGGSSEKNGDGFDTVGSMMADNWREASFLQDWCCDGIVLSNDEPYAHTSNGANDVQQFNICVQGISTCNNGYKNHKGLGVESYSRAITERNGYGTQGSVAIGGTPYYASYPMQMFDRKVKTLSTLYVGLVATKRRLTPEIKGALKENSNLNTDSLNYMKLNTAGEKYQSFYTFKFVCFSDHSARQGGLKFNIRDDWKYAEPPSKKQKPVHHADVTRGSLAFDPYEPASLSDYRGMVGAWKIGKVLDTAARRKDVYSGGPIDTAEQLNVNVCIEWCDWRKLRRSVDREDIGAYVSGAPMWLHAIPGTAEPLGVDGKTDLIVAVDTDDKRIFNWPSTYVERSSRNMGGAAKDKAAEQANAPISVDRDTGFGSKFDLKESAEDQFNKYVENAKRVHDVIGNVGTAQGFKNLITRVRANNKDRFAKLSDDEVDTLFNAIAAPDSNSFTLTDLQNWIGNLDFLSAMNLKFVKAFWGTNAETAENYIKRESGGSDLKARQLFLQIAVFTDAGETANEVERFKVTKSTLSKFLSPAADDQVGVLNAVPDVIGEHMERAVNLLINHQIDMTGGTGMVVVEDTSVSAAPVAPVARTRVPKSNKAKVSSSSTSGSAPTSGTSSTAATSAFPAAVSANTAASKPSGKPAAKTVTGSEPMETEPTAVQVAPAAQPAQPAQPASEVSGVSGASNKPDLFSHIFGNSAGKASETDKSPSSGNARPKVRRTREGR